MRNIAWLMVALPLGGCMTDAETANNRSVLPLVSAPAKDDGTGERRQLCESTMEGTESKTVCY